MTRVLFHSPYASWHYHGVQEITLGHALSHRGADVRFLTCDGVFPVCDVWREGINPRHERSCNDCQHRVAKLFDGMAMPYEWLGAFLPRAARAAVAGWVSALEPTALPDARWRGRPVGEWARSSAFYQYRMSRFELSDPKVVAGLRAHVQGAALASEALAVALDEIEPDLLFLLNGRFFSHQAAFDMARERGIRVITHERGLLRGTLRLAEDARIHDLGIYDEIWDRWKDVPLDASELSWVAGVLDDRRHGRNLPLGAFSPLPDHGKGVREQLGLGDRPLLTLFSSSDDESASFSDRRRGAYPDSLEWLTATVDLARRFPDHAVVLRLHPNLVRNGVNQQTLDHANALAASLPGNCRIVMPDDPVSSYALADESAVGLVYFSTLGLEMATRGQPVVAVARGWYGLCDFVRYARRPEEYAQRVAEAAAEGRSRSVARRALRFAHHLYREMSIPFSLVVEEPRHHGKALFRSTGDLGPGSDPHLDRLCRVLLGEEPLLRVPGPAHSTRTTTAEDRFLETRVPASATPSARMVSSSTSSLEVSP